MTHFPDLSGSDFTREAVTMAAWLKSVMSRFPSRKSAPAERQASACLRSGSSRLIQKSAFSNQGCVRQSMNGCRRSDPILERIFRSLRLSLMPSYNCLATILKSFLSEVFNTIRGRQNLSGPYSILFYSQLIGGLA